MKPLPISDPILDRRRISFQRDLEFRAISEIKWEEGRGGEKRGPACHRSPSAEPRTEETVKTCAVLTPTRSKFRPSYGPGSRPSNANLGNCAESFCLRPTKALTAQISRRKPQVLAPPVLE